MSCYNIMAVVLNNRVQNAVKFQDVLTESGCIIKTRLGLHDAGDACTNEGLIILQLAGSGEEIGELKDKINAIEGAKAELIKICPDW